MTPARKKYIESLKDIAVNTYDGKKSIFELCYEIGVIKREIFYCDVERLKKKSDRRINSRTEIKREYHDYILYFKDGWSMRVSRKLYMLFSEVKTIETRKRI